MYTLNKINLILSILLLVLLSPIAAVAQTMSSAPEVSMIDEGGVDMMSGLPSINQTDLNIGAGTNSLTHSFSSYNGYLWGIIDDFNNINILETGGNTYKVSTGQSTTIFQTSPEGKIYPKQQDGSQLQYNAGTNTYTYTSRMGVKYDLNSSIRSIEYPNGFKVSIHRNYAYRANGHKDYRVNSVVTNTGLQFKYIYESSTLGSFSADDYRKFRAPIEIIAINNKNEYCSVTANTCPLTLSWPSVKYSWPLWSEMFSSFGGTDVGQGTVTVTDAEGVETHYIHKKYRGVKYSTIDHSDRIYTRIYKIRSSASGLQDLKTFDYTDIIHCTHYFIDSKCSVIKSKVAYKTNIGPAEWTYGHPQPATQYVSEVNSTGPRGRFTKIVMANQGGSLSVRRSASSPNGVFITYTENTANRPKSVTDKGIKSEYFYDSRGNITKIIRGEGADQLVTEADYPTTCENIKTCNKPNWIKDFNGNITYYTYHTQSGEIETIQYPPDINGDVFVEQNTYNQYHAWYKKNNESIVRDSNPLWLLSEKKYCTQGNFNDGICESNNYLVLHSYEYGAGSSAIGNNLWLTSEVVDAFDDQVGERSKLRTCYKYDSLGNQISTISPNANLTSCP